MSKSIKPYFCPKCSKIMVPLNVENDLYYICRDVGCAEKIKIDDPSDFCLFAKNYAIVQSTSHQTNVRFDPTYPRTTKACPSCNCDQIFVYYYASHWDYNCSLKIFYICTVCGYETEEGGNPIE